MSRSKKSDSGYYDNQPGLGGLVQRTILKARRKMYRSLMETVQPTPEYRVLDVGVTSDRRPDSNFFEKWYPYPQQIIAVGIEDAAFLEEEVPGVKFLLADGLDLPFPDKSFDLVLSFAVLEHVGSRERQRAFVHELCRVGRTCCFTTPNRWFPIEVHSVMPLVHWLPSRWFRRVLRAVGKHFWSHEENLNLLSHPDMMALFPTGARVCYRPHKLLGWVSNLVYFVES